MKIVLAYLQGKFWGSKNILGYGNLKIIQNEHTDKYFICSKFCSFEMASFEQEAEKDDVAANHGTQKLLFLVIVARILF